MLFITTCETIACWGGRVSASDQQLLAVCVYSYRVITASCRARYQGRSIEQVRYCPILADIADTRCRYRPSSYFWQWLGRFVSRFHVRRRLIEKTPWRWCCRLLSICAKWDKFIILPSSFAGWIDSAVTEMTESPLMLTQLTYQCSWDYHTKLLLRLDHTRAIVLTKAAVQLCVHRHSRQLPIRPVCDVTSHTCSNRRYSREGHTRAAIWNAFSRLPTWRNTA